MTDEDQAGLHPAEHRGYRELGAAAHHLLRRWPHLAEAVRDTDCAPALGNGALRVRELLDALEPRIAAYDLHVGPAAQGAGAGLGSLRFAVIDRSLDTGVAVRLAVLDIEHITTLLAHLAALAAARDDEDLEAFCADWAKRLRSEVKAIRRVAIGLGLDPDRTAQPLHDSPLGQVAHRAGWALGTVGEWFDRRAGEARRTHEEG